MSGTVPEPAVLDSTVFSNFASTDSMSLLVEVLPRPGTVPTVEAELERGVEAGYAFLESALTVVGSDVPVLEPPEPVPNRIAVALDPGEAEALAVADALDGTLVSDDGDARTLADREDVPITGSLGVLARGVVQEKVDVETANSWLDTWQTEHEYYSPVDDVSELLPGE